jgi:DNA-binding NarL/FixJ family response regulator
MEIRISCSKLSHFSIPKLRSFLPQRMEKPLESICKHRPDVAVLDLKLPGINGLEIVERAATCISSPQVVMCCTESDPDFIDAAFQAGIRVCSQKTDRI